MFTLDESQKVKLYAWMEQQDARVATMQQGGETPYYGCSGGGYSYTFTPTTLGVCVVVRNNITQDEIDLSDTANW